MNGRNPDDMDEELNADGMERASEEPDDAGLAHEPDPGQPSAGTNRSGSNPNIINK